ncbi:MAG: low-specificity L-threonine aldolase [Ignavibacteriae bacterium]|nr:low-specificity L-threonine aldolase [Ignavibacteriota bacterium]
MKYIDLRSDTVTKPSQGMLEAMMKAEVGDDVFGEDPTVNKLQERVASMFGKEAALFVPSGVMGNQVSIKVHTQPGDEILLDQDSHIFVYETGASAFLSGVQMRSVMGVDGMMTSKQLRKMMRPRAYYLPIQKLICLENTFGRTGGTIYPFHEIQQIHQLAKDYKLRMHLDGARIWNACIATKIQPREYAHYFDSISVCFSKGLGAPVGSMIISSREFIDRARRYRKLFGGGMRQSGILAAAALYALDNNIERLKEDHEKATFFANALKDVQMLHIDKNTVQTNMVIIEIQKLKKSQQEVLTMLKEQGVLMTPERHSSIRAVFHLDVSMDEVKEAADVLQRLFG